MKTVEPTACLRLSENHEHPFKHEDKHYQPHVLRLGHGKAVILEDISEMEKLTKQLAEKNRKLQAIHDLLMHREKIKTDTTRYPERDTCAWLIEMLFKRKVDDACQTLQTIKTSEQISGLDIMKLRHMRFMITLCQMRLRLVLRILSSYPDFLLEQLSSYSRAITEKSSQIGLDVAINASGQTRFQSDSLVDLLDMIDRLCLLLLDQSSLSLVIHVQINEACIVLTGFYEPVLAGEDEQNLLNQIAVRVQRDLSTLDDKKITSDQAINREGLSLKVIFPATKMEVEG